MTQKKSESKPPWKTKNPKSRTGAKSTKLNEEDKQRAKDRAEKAGRPYPNLIDNMWAAQNKDKWPE